MGYAASVLTSLLVSGFLPFLFYPDRNVAPLMPVTAFYGGKLGQRIGQEITDRRLGARPERLSNLNK